MLEGLYTLAYNLYTSGKLVDAETVFRLCACTGTQFRFWMGLAGCRQANGNQAGAIDAYSMAGVASGLSDPTPFLYAAHCYIRIGDKENAVGALQGVMTMGDASNPEHAACRDKAAELLKMLQTQA